MLNYPTWWHFLKEHWFVLPYQSVDGCSRVRACACACAHVDARDRHRRSFAVTRHYLFLRLSLALNLKLTNLAKLASQQVPGVLWCPPPQRLQACATSGFAQHLPSTGIAALCNIWLFYMDGGDGAPVLTLVLHVTD